MSKSCLDFATFIDDLSMASLALPGLFTSCFVGMKKGKKPGLIAMLTTGRNPSKGHLWALWALWAFVGICGHLSDWLMPSFLHPSCVITIQTAIAYGGECLRNCLCGHPVPKMGRRMASNCMFFEEIQWT